MVAAGAAVSDMSGFCDRQPNAARSARSRGSARARAQSAPSGLCFLSEHSVRGEPGWVTSGTAALAGVAGHAHGDRSGAGLAGPPMQAGSAADAAQGPRRKGLTGQA